MSRELACVLPPCVVVTAFSARAGLCGVRVGGSCTCSSRTRRTWRRSSMLVWSGVVRATAHRHRGCVCWLACCPRERDKSPSSRRLRSCVRHTQLICGPFIPKWASPPPASPPALSDPRWLRGTCAVSPRHPPLFCHQSATKLTSRALRLGEMWGWSRSLSR